MKTMKHALAALGLIGLAMAVAVYAQPAPTDGEVRKVDAAGGKLTLKHDGIKNLDMPAMTMAFRVKDPAWLAKLQPGEKVSFTADKVDGQLTVTSISPK